MLREEVTRTRVEMRPARPGGVVCPGFWLLATVGPPSPWFPGEAPPHPHCLPAHWRVVEQVLREAGTCIGSHPASQPKGQTEAGGRRSQAWPASSPMGSPDAKFLKLRLPGTW